MFALLGIYPREMKTLIHTETYTWMFITVKYICNTLKLETIQVFINKIDKWSLILSYIECYSTTKWNDVIIHAAT